MRLVLALEAHGDLRAETAQHLVGGVDDEPVAAHGLGLRKNSRHHSTTPTTGKSPHIFRRRRRRSINDWRAPGKRGASVLNAPCLCKTGEIRLIIAPHGAGTQSGHLYFRGGPRPAGPAGASGGRPARPGARLPGPARDTQKADAALTADDRRESAALMRVNHAGEVAAQALYHAQALFARDPRGPRIHAARGAGRDRSPGLVRGPAQGAGQPAQRAQSALVCGIVRHRRARRTARRSSASLGFVAETERQVEGHLKSHLDRLPDADLRSRAIVEAMLPRRSRARPAGAKCRRARAFPGPSAN